MARLGDIVTVQAKSRIKANAGMANGKYKFFTSSNTQTKWLNEYQYDKPALIFGTGGMPSVHYCDAKFSTSTDCIVLYGSATELQTIYYFLEANMHLLSEGFHGIGLQHISKNFILNLEIPKINENSQRAIVAVANIIDNLIILRKQQLDKLDELVTARFVEMFGDPVINNHKWQTQPLDNVCKTIVDCPHSTPSYTDENTGYMCIRTSIVKKNHILWDEIEYIPEHEYYQRIQRKRPEKGDVVYTREGAILGIAAMIDRQCNVALGQRSMLLSPDTTKCLPQFLSVAMNFESFLRKALGGVSGSASPHINVGDIKAFAVIVPPIELQQQFTVFVEQTDKSKLTIQQGLDKLEMMKKALMQQFFRNQNRKEN